MRKYNSLSKKVSINQKIRKDKKDSAILSLEHLNTIKNDSRTEVIKFPLFKEAFNYVENIFPSLNIRDLSIYKVSPILLKKIGYNGVGGFFNTLSKDVVISSYLCSQNSSLKFKLKAEVDDILVHELLHYCYNISGMKSTSLFQIEEFAYGWSWGYLKSKGCSKDFAIKYNFSPFLAGFFYEKSFNWVLEDKGINRKDFDNYTQNRKNRFYLDNKIKIENKIFEYSYSLGEDIIKRYELKMEEKTTYGNIKTSVENNKVSLLDLDD